MSVEFGEILRELRIQAGYGLRQFAEMIGDAPSNYADIEAGIRTPWVRTPDKLRYVAERLGLAEGGANWDRFFMAAGNNAAVPPDLQEVLDRPGVPMFLRTVDELRLTEEDLRKLAESLRKKKIARAKKKK